MKGFDAQALIDSGDYLICQCSFLIRRDIPACRKCGTPIPAISAPKPRRRNSGKPATAAHSTGDALVRPEALGGMAARPVIWIVSLGNPKTQGSMVAVAAGRMRAADEEMYAWRNTITTDAARLFGMNWRPVNAPVQIDVAFTLPFPENFEDQSTRIAAVDDGELPRIPVMQPPDRDKLLRAVQDALSPLDRSNKGTKTSQALEKRFKLVVDDALFVHGSEAKTYARPGHTHAWALDRPGAVIRVSVIDTDIEPMPRPTLRMPGDLPAEAAQLQADLIEHEKLHGNPSSKRTTRARKRR